MTDQTSDKQIPVQDLKDAVKAFCEERDWDQFHSPKELAIGITTEAAELLDEFRFQTRKDESDILEDPVQRKAIEHELGDIGIFLLRFAQLYGFDLSQCILKKLQINQQKYPISKARGSNKKHRDLQV